VRRTTPLDGTSTSPRTARRRGSTTRPPATARSRCCCRRPQAPTAASTGTCWPTRVCRNASRCTPTTCPTTASRCLRSGCADGRRPIAPAAVGLLIAQLALARGAAAVYLVHLDQWRLKQAEEFGAVPVPGGEGAVARVLELTGGNGVDVAIDAVGAIPAISTALACVALGGTSVSSVSCSTATCQSPRRTCSDAR
jgi:Zinc-binding dehydrogenase